MNKEKITQEINGVLWQCENVIRSKSEVILITPKKIFDNINKVSYSHCGSWLGYQSSIYYKNFKTIPAGAHFDMEWGLHLGYSNKSTGEWVEYDFSSVESYVLKGISNEIEQLLVKESENAVEIVGEIKNHFETLLEILTDEKNTPFLIGIKDNLNQIKISTSQSDLIKASIPRKQYISRDSLALAQGIIAPHHIQLKTWLLSLLSPFYAVDEIFVLAKKTLNYMKLNDILMKSDSSLSNKVFIGHGRSKIWCELKDFLQDRLKLEFEEFNRQSVAGMTTIERLQDMLFNSSFAFLIMTAEDEHSDSSLHARENVIHEVGLFQGKLGFRKAIILLEEGCKEFSNIIGLSQIRFAKDNFSAKFEEIRQVLEREGVIK